MPQSYRGPGAFGLAPVVEGDAEEEGEGGGEDEEDEDEEEQEREERSNVEASSASACVCTTAAVDLVMCNMPGMLLIVSFCFSPYVSRDVHDMGASTDLSSGPRSRRFRTLDFNGFCYCTNHARNIKNNSCEIEDFVETHLCNLCGVLRSRVCSGF